MIFDEKLAGLEREISIIDHHIAHYQSLWDDALQAHIIVSSIDKAYTSTPHAYTTIKYIGGPNPMLQEDKILKTYVPTMHGYIVRLPAALARRKALKTAVKELVAQESKLGSVTQISKKNIPHHIFTAADHRKKINNPYFKGTTDLYAGDPSGFTWGPQTNNFLAIRKAALRNGLEFNTVYSSTIVYNLSFRGRTQNLRTFAVIAGGDSLGGDLVWYKYESSPGAGNNYLYIKGKQMATTGFIAMSPAAQDKLLKGCQTP
jgi:hypothetical protein